MSTPYSPQHRWMEWLVGVQVASRGCGSPVCLHTSRLGTAATPFAFGNFKYNINPLTTLKNNRYFINLTKLQCTVYLHY
jgi:hypothetical protein